MVAFGLNLVDVLIVLLAALSVAVGFRRGAALQIITYVGLLLGLAVGAVVAPAAAHLVHGTLARAVVALLTFLVIAGLGDGLGWVVGTRVWAAARRSRLSPIDSAAGSVVAVLAVLLAVWFVGLNLVNGPFPALADEIQGSRIIRGLDRNLPDPPSLLTEIRRLFNRFGFPEVFRALPPAPAGPVQGPTQGQTAEAARVAKESTVRIVGQACGVILEGSGFLAADHYVVTNAHVVAGVRAPEVQEQGGGSQPGTTVLFDPELDVAILRVGTDPGPVLPLQDGVVDRGARGAVLGYPGGGDLTIGPAAVRRELEAVGRDIYGRRTVQRSVYELQAIVRPGNSGGPFVLVDGQVAGLVFAASSTEPDIGYAITTDQVVDRVNQAAGRTQSVDTGPCVR